MSEGSDGASTERGSWQAWHDDERPLRLGASSCLLGEEVRFNSGHCRERFLTDVLGPFVEWVGVCPEVESGMAIPRPAIRLVDEDDGRGLRLMTSPRQHRGAPAPPDGAIEDHTEAMERFSAARLRALGQAGLDGFVLKKDSPTCGLERVKVYAARDDKGAVRHRRGRGLFAEALARALPDLPLEEEGRLNDAHIREAFIERIFCHNRWRGLAAQEPDRGRLVAFHTAHKLLLWAHQEVGMRRLGRLLGEAGRLPDAELLARYGAGFHEVMRQRATPRRHMNVLQHAMGYLKKVLSPERKRSLIAALEDYHRGLLPLVVPISLLRHEISAHGIEYLQGPLYFEPHPRELMLRNHD
jgi:uncharacterized protein YbgA (DUF1722 family)/uncharacterized protein YbbK (DUF523 family)